MYVLVWPKISIYGWVHDGIMSSWLPTLDFGAVETLEPIRVYMPFCERLLTLMLHRLQPFSLLPDMAHSLLG